MPGDVYITLHINKLDLFLPLDSYKINHFVIVIIILSRGNMPQDAINYVRSLIILKLTRMWHLKPLHYQLFLRILRVKCLT